LHPTRQSFAGDGALSEAAGDSRDFTPGVRQYEIQRRQRPAARYRDPPPEVKERIAREAEAILFWRGLAIRRQRFSLGLRLARARRGKRVFGSQRIDNGVAMSPHYAWDMAAPTGTPITRLPMA